MPSLERQENYDFLTGAYRVLHFAWGGESILRRIIMSTEQVLEFIYYFQKHSLIVPREQTNVCSQL